MSESVTIEAADGTGARIALTGAEPVSWTVAGRECLWQGDPRHWNRCAPWLFPVVGASVDGRIRVDGRAYPMAQHGFARDATFTIVERSADAVTLRLAQDAATRRHFPFDFRLDIQIAVRSAALDFRVSVSNSGDRPLPYALGFHPGFPWPFTLARVQGHSVVFEKPERAHVPVVGAGGTITREKRPVPLSERTLPLDSTMFEEALVFLDASSREMRFTAPDGAAIVMRVEDFPHLAIWTKPTAPFLSLECWTGHADIEGFDGELSERASQRILAPLAEATHRVCLGFQGPKA